MPLYEIHLRETKHQKIPGYRGSLREDETGAQGIRRYLRQENPPGADRDLGAYQGWKRGERIVMGHSVRRRHTLRCAETSGGRWRLEGADNVQVDCVSLRESWWVAGARERGYCNKLYL